MKGFQNYYHTKANARRDQNPVHISTVSLTIVALIRFHLENEKEKKKKTKERKDQANVRHLQHIYKWNSNLTFVTPVFQQQMAIFL